MSEKKDISPKSPGFLMALGGAKKGVKEATKALNEGDEATVKSALDNAFDQLDVLRTMTRDPSFKFTGLTDEENQQRHALEHRLRKYGYLPEGHQKILIELQNKSKPKAKDQTNVM